MLCETKLSVSCERHILDQIERLGEVTKLPPGARIFAAEDPPDYMYVVLEGSVFVGDLNDYLIGAGDIFGEVGFFLGTGRTKPCTTGDHGARVWRISRDLLYRKDLDKLTLALLTHFLLALAPHIHIRLLILSGNEEHGVFYPSSRNAHLIPDYVQYECDFEHPAIMNLVPFLRRDDDWETVRAVWNLVSHLPFRFGYWHTRASKTLEVGFGTTTSKANLQVALLRALGMEAGYALIKIPGDFYEPLKPVGYRYNQNNAMPVDYTFCAVRINETWFPCDATFTTEALELMAQERKEFQKVVDNQFQTGTGFSLEAILGKGPFGDMEINEVLQTELFHIDAGNLEAMNIRLDQAQGAMYHVPIWMAAAKALLRKTPEAAFLKTYASIVSDLDLFIRLLGRGGPNEEINLVI